MSSINHLERKVKSQSWNGHTSIYPKGLNHNVVIVEHFLLFLFIKIVLFCWTFCRCPIGDLPWMTLVSLTVTALSLEFKKVVGLNLRFFALTPFLTPSVMSHRDSHIYGLCKLSTERPKSQEPLRPTPIQWILSSFKINNVVWTSKLKKWDQTDPAVSYPATLGKQNNCEKELE